MEEQRTETEQFKSNAIAVLLYRCERWCITRNDAVKSLRRLMKIYWLMKVNKMTRVNSNGYSTDGTVDPKRLKVFLTF